MESLIEKRDDDEMKESDGEKNADEMSENDMEEEEEEFFEDFYDENIKNVVMKGLNDAQRERFEIFRTATIDQSKGNNKIKEFVASVLPGISVGHSCKLILATAAKIYAGELVEESRKIMSEKGDKGAIEPNHLREAYRRINNRKMDDKFSENEMLYF